MGEIPRPNECQQRSTLQSTPWILNQYIPERPSCTTSFVPRQYLLVSNFDIKQICSLAATKMSLPPATVKIKRKATDDPVEFLRMLQTAICRQFTVLTKLLGIHESGGSGKRQRQDTGYIFSRQSITNDSTASQSSSPAPRKIAQLPQPTSSSLRQAGSVSISQNATQTVPPTNATPFSSLNSQPRRFHISRRP